MIQQTKIEKKPKIQTGNRKNNNSLTIPGLAMNLKFAMEQFKRNTLIEKTKAYYETKGFEMPNFSMMSRIERLQALSDFRHLKQKSFDEIIKTQKDALEQKQTAKAAKAAKDSGGNPPGESNTK